LLEVFRTFYAVYFGEVLELETHEINAFLRLKSRDVERDDQNSTKKIGKQNDFLATCIRRPWRSSCRWHFASVV